MKLLLQHTLTSRLEEIERLAEAVNAALPTRPDLAFMANLCLEELITNTITYGLKGEPGRMIEVRLSMSEEWLEIRLKDDAPLEERPIGGLGVHIVKSLMDEAHAYYDGSGNLIVLLKAVQQPAPQ